MNVAVSHWDCAMPWRVPEASLEGGWDRRCLSRHKSDQRWARFWLPRSFDWSIPRGGYGRLLHLRRPGSPPWT
jgi:hypothetical protein